MALAVQVQAVDATGVGIWVTGVLVASGNYSTGGDTVNFQAAVAQANALNAINLGPIIESSQIPYNFDAWSQSGNTANGYFAIIGTTQANCKLKVITAFNTELSAGAYPGSVTGDNIAFMAIFPKLL